MSDPLRKRTFQSHSGFYTNTAPHAASVPIHESTMKRNAFPPGRHRSDNVFIRALLYLQTGNLANCRPEKSAELTHASQTYHVPAEASDFTRNQHRHLVTSCGKNSKTLAPGATIRYCRKTVRGRRQRSKRKRMPDYFGTTKNSSRGLGHSLDDRQSTRSNPGQRLPAHKYLGQILGAGDPFRRAP